MVTHRNSARAQIQLPKGVDEMVDPCTDYKFIFQFLLQFRYVINKPGLNQTIAPFNCAQKEILLMQQRNTKLLPSVTSLYKLLPSSNNKQNDDEWVERNFQSTSSSAIRNIILKAYPSVRI